MAKDGGNARSESTAGFEFETTVRFVADILRSALA
jgi:hypothetical protein